MSRERAWGKFGLGEWITSISFGVAAATFALIGPIGDHTWQGGLGGPGGLDEDVRDALRANTLHDRFAAAAGSDPELTRLLEEFGSFTDVRLGADSSSELLKSVSDISIWADNPEE